MAAGGDFVGNAVGKDTKITAAPSPAPVRTSGEWDVLARGEGAAAAGGDMRGNAFGDGSEVQ
jgi:hypothetical protein